MCIPMWVPDANTSCRVSDASGVVPKCLTYSRANHPNSHRMPKRSVCIMRYKTKTLSRVRVILLSMPRRYSNSRTACSLYKIVGMYNVDVVVLLFKEVLKFS